MFSGIVEEAGRVVRAVYEEGNLQLTVACSFTDELSIDQSVAHNGVCLTVVSINGDGTYTVTAIQETLSRTNLGEIYNIAQFMRIPVRHLLIGRMHSD